jgi:UDP-3-O-[3-hydroxymyristoyl] N-acetylglucosamine deacetylase
MIPQCTILKRISLEGIGLHSGKLARVTLHPAPVNTGIVFISREYGEKYGIRAHYKNLINTSKAITVGNRAFNIMTIEHFMASLYAYDISNAYISVEGSEIPILDGSAKDFVSAIEEAGIEVQNEPQEVFYVPYPIWVEENGSYLIVLPNSQFKVTYTIDFTLKSEAIGTQTAHYIVDKNTFKHSIAPARTFGFYEELEEMKRNNLALGGSLDNALLFTRGRLVNDGLRFTNECVRHKMLDLIGDLSLIGCKVIGHFIAYKAGHSMDIALVEKIDRALRRKKSRKAISRKFMERRESEFSRFKKRVNLT